MRTAKYIILFLVFFNAGGLLLESAGADAWLGLEFTTGDNEALEDAQDRASGATDDVSGVGGTLFAFYTTTTEILSAIMNAINPGASMLKAAVASPTFDQIVTYTFSGMWAIVGFTVIEFLRGADI